MLTILRNGNTADFAALSSIYEERVIANGEKSFPYEDASVRYLLARQTFYSYVLDFLTKQQGIWALWRADGVYQAACRLEVYRDGFLLSGLETEPAGRGRGYATALVNEVIAYAAQTDAKAIYSHVEKKNYSSLAVHKKCGFHLISDTAVLLDGSADSSICTLKHIIKV